MLGRDFGEAPARGGAVRTCAGLHDIAALPAPDLDFVVIACGIAPSDAPRADGGIPHPQRGAVHVELLVEAWMAVGPARHDPDILHGTALQDPTRVHFTLDAPRC